MTYGQPAGNNQPMDNTNRISLWNGDKSKNAKAPDLKGTINVNGVEYVVSLWSTPQSNNKSPILSGSIQPKQAQQGGGYAQPVHQPQQYAQPMAQPHQAMYGQNPHQTTPAPVAVGMANGMPNDDIPF